MTDHFVLAAVAEHESILTDETEEVPLFVYGPLCFTGHIKHQSYNQILYRVKTDSQ